MIELKYCSARTSVAIFSADEDTSQHFHSLSPALRRKLENEIRMVLIVFVYTLEESSFAQ